MTDPNEAEAAAILDGMKRAAETARNGGELPPAGGDQLDIEIVEVDPLTTAIADLWADVDRAILLFQLACGAVAIVALIGALLMIVALLDRVRPAGRSAARILEADRREARMEASRGWL